ncbi:MAG: DUF547 domain-containing protein [Bacteroidia bacterium]|nr:DUF547 domain-containing protein [Bacteroidia bacterium]
MFIQASWFLLVCLSLPVGFGQPGGLPAFPMPEDYLDLSVALLEKVRDQQDYAPIVQKLAEASELELMSQLTNDAAKKAFWINIYNAFTQIKLGEAPALYENRGQFFKLNFIHIAGRALSLDQIEHDFLRKSKIKLSLGYLSKPFSAHYIKKYRVNKLDYRVHFALNCGAASCPPVRVSTLTEWSHNFRSLPRLISARLHSMILNQPGKRKRPDELVSGGFWQQKGYPANFEAISAYSAEP